MSEMTPRERVITALTHQEPDRLPISIGGSAHKLTDPTYFRLLEHFGIEKPVEPVLTGNSFSYNDNRVLDALGTDVRYLHMHPPREYYAAKHPDGSYEDWWHLTFKKMGDQYMYVHGPLGDATITDLEGFPWPEPMEPGRVEGLREEARQIYEETDYAIAAYRPTPAGLFETAWMMRGMEKFMMDMLLDKPFANALLDKIQAIHMGLYRLQLEAVGEYVQIVEMLDDYGSQDGPLISPKLYQEMLKPRHVEMVQEIKRLAHNAKILFHSCGSVYSFVEDFIDVGFDILNPVQPIAKDMDPARLKREFGSRMCFLGGVDVQVAMRGSLAQAEEEVKTRIRQLGPGGGYVFAPSHNVFADIPLENFLSMIEWAKTFGRYPIQI
jgi:uroporphyrinogen decarboxylase